MRIILRRLRSLLWTALTLLTILAAMLVGIGKLLMPYSDRYQPQLEAWLSEEFNHPIRIDSFTGEWKAFGPRISLEGVTFTAAAGGQDEIAIQHAALDIKPLNSLLPGRPLYSFHIIGADLALVHHADGRWELSGLGVGGRPESGGSGVGVLATVGELRLEDSVLSFTDSAQEIALHFTGVGGRLQLDGPDIAAEIQANVSDLAQGRILGDIEATLLMQLDEEQRLAGASWHAKTRELMISQLVRQIPQHPLVPQGGWLNAELWGAWTRETGQLMEGVVDVRDARLAGQPQPLLVDHLNARFRWNFQARKIWRLDFSEFRIEQGGSQWATDRLSVERNIPGDLGIWVSADFLDIGFPLELTQRIMSVYKTPWPRNVPRRASGRIHGFDLVLDRRWKLYLAKGRFENTNAWDWDRWPDVSGVRGQVDLAGGFGQVEFLGQGIGVTWPRNFAGALSVDIPACTLEILWGGAWQVEARDCRIRNDLIEASGRLRFAKNEGRPAVDINTVIHRARIGDLDDYWPRSLMKPKLTDWLSRGLVSGDVSSGRFIMRGDMDDWPFNRGQGLLEARLDFREADLDYSPGWPRAVRLNGTAHFLGASMRVEASAGGLGGVPVQTVKGAIENLRSPVLRLEYATAASLPGLVGFLRETPLLDNSRLDLDRFRLTGDARIAGVLSVPLRADGERISVTGELELADNGFTERDSGFQLEGIIGPLRFDRDGLSADSLQASYLGRPVGLSIEADWTQGASFRSDLAGFFPVQEVIPAAILQGEPLLQRISGSTEIAATLTVDPEAGDGRGETWLELASNLEGVEIALPAPLAKPAAASWPTVVRFPVSAESGLCTITSPNRLTMAFDIPQGFQQVRRASFLIGGGPASLPPPGQLRIGGTASSLDLDGWVNTLSQRFAAQPGIGRLDLDSIALRAEQMILLNRQYQGVDLGLGFSDGVLTGSFDSERLVGEIRYSSSEDGAHSLIAQMDRLVLGESSDGEILMETDPSRLPEMHIYVKDFRYLGMELGETRIEAYPRQNGFRFASVEAVSPEFTLNARGDWLKDEAGQRSDFKIVMTSESLGSLMHAMEISSVLEGGQTMLSYEAWWPGPPAAFALARLNGNISFSVIEGTIVNADAGAGRMVGLMSITALPRRLALDFRDVFGAGFSFDQANGNVTLENGIAHTDDMVLTSTAATMEIAGSSDLDAQTFDYIMSVKPGVGQTLPVLGALAGGPGGAAAGLALQGLLQKSLGEAAEARYSITGAWKEPRVVRIPMEPKTERGATNE